MNGYRFPTLTPEQRSSYLSYQHRIWFCSYRFIPSVTPVLTSTLSARSRSVLILSAYNKTAAYMSTFQNSQQIAVAVTPEGSTATLRTIHENKTSVPFVKDCNKNMSKCHQNKITHSILFIGENFEQWHLL